MKRYTFLRVLIALGIVCAVSLVSSPVYGQGKGHGKAKGKQNHDTKENHGREGGELPYGLGVFMEKKGEGELPSGLQKKKVEGSLARGLEEGGKNPTFSTKGKTRAK